MKTASSIGLLLILLIAANFSRGQVSGNIGYSEAGGKARAEQRERSKRVLTEHELPPSMTSSFVECNILMNVKADEYVAIFGVAREGVTLEECSAKMDATLAKLTEDLKALGIADDDLFVDFIAQTKTYGYEVEGDILQEKLVGFELKKNLSIRYQDPALLDKITLAAARSQVFDLIKVDYIVNDIPGMQDKLMEEAASTMKKKLSRYENLLGIKLKPPAQIYAEKSAIHYPTQMYDSYTAAETESVRGTYDRQRYTIRNARKSRTFFFNGLSADGFDAVINPVVTEPVVQFTLYLKLKYEVEQPAAN